MLSCFVSRCSSRAMQRNVAVSWRPSWSRGVFVHSFPRSSLPTQRPINSSFSTKTWWRPYTSTPLTSFSCSSQRLAKTQMQHTEERRYTPKSPNHFSFPRCSLICLTGWTMPILCFRSEPVCWSWSTELSASAAEILSLNFSRLFTSLPNTGLGFYATISLITTVTAYVCSWPVSVCVCLCIKAE